MPKFLTIGVNEWCINLWCVNVCVVSCRPRRPLVRWVLMSFERAAATKQPQLFNSKWPDDVLRLFLSCQYVTSRCVIHSIEWEGVIVEFPFKSVQQRAWNDEIEPERETLSSNSSENLSKNDPWYLWNLWEFSRLFPFNWMEPAWCNSLKIQLT